METSTNIIVNCLHYLSWVQNNRLEGYGRAEEFENIPHRIQDIVSDGIGLSSSCLEQLAKTISLFGIGIANDPVSSWASSHAWIDVKTSLKSRDTAEICSAFETGERATLRAYDYALKINSMPGYIREMLLAQQTKLHEQYDKICRLHLQETVSAEQAFQSPAKISLYGKVSAGRLSKPGLFSAGRL